MSAMPDTVKTKDGKVHDVTKFPPETKNLLTLVVKAQEELVEAEKALQSALAKVDLYKIAIVTLHQQLDAQVTNLSNIEIVKYDTHVNLN